MAFIPVPQVAEISVRHRYAGENLYNILNVITELTITQARLEQLATGTLQAWGDNIMSQLSVLLTLEEVVVRDMSTQDGVQASESFLTPLPGSATGQGMPANVAICMTHRTGRIGRSRRGRTYFGGISENNVNGNVADQAFLADLEAGFTAVKQAWFTLGWQLVIVSRVADGQPRGQGLSTIVTESSFRDPRIDTQRRRLPEG